MQRFLYIPPGIWRRETADLSTIRLTVEDAELLIDETQIPALAISSTINGKQATEYTANGHTIHECAVLGRDTPMRFLMRIDVFEKAVDDQLLMALPTLLVALEQGLINFAIYPTQAVVRLKLHDASVTRRSYSCRKDILDWLGSGRSSPLFLTRRQDSQPVTKLPLEGKLTAYLNCFCESQPFPVGTVDELSRARSSPENFPESGYYCIIPGWSWKQSLRRQAERIVRQVLSTPERARTGRRPSVGYCHHGMSIGPICALFGDSERLLHDQRQRDSRSVQDVLGAGDLNSGGALHVRDCAGKLWPLDPAPSFSHPMELSQEHRGFATPHADEASKTVTSRLTVEGHSALFHECQPTMTTYYVAWEPLVLELDLTKLSHAHIAPAASLAFFFVLLRHLKNSAILVRWRGVEQPGKMTVTRIFFLVETDTPLLTRLQDTVIDSDDFAQLPPETWGPLTMAWSDLLQKAGSRCCVQAK